MASDRVPQPQGWLACAHGSEFRTVVFSFKNRSDQPEKDWISNALAEGIRADINGLARFYALPGDLMEKMQEELILPSAFVPKTPHKKQYGRGMSRPSGEFNPKNDLELSGMMMREKWLKHGSSARVRRQHLRMTK